MDCKPEELRKIIRETLSDKYITSLREGQERNGANVGDWAFYEEFGIRLLQAAGYQGTSRDLIYQTKSELEKYEGWYFDNL